MLPGAVAGGIHLTAGGEDPQNGARDQPSEAAAQSIGNQVIHIEETVGPGIETVKSAQLGELEKHRQSQGPQESSGKGAAEPVSEIHSERYDHENVEAKLPEGRIVKDTMGRQFLQEIPDDTTGIQVHGPSGHMGDSIPGRQRQNHQEIHSHEIEDEGVDHQDPKGPHRTVFVIVVKNVGCCKQQSCQGKPQKGIPDHLDISIHGSIVRCRRKMQSYIRVILPLTLPPLPRYRCNRQLSLP